ncbi:MAG TPA: 4Fe-4S dicluster-binding protein [Dehalococcoidia bacterium]|nr:4Fe-4S dicluster-binding protein [Dehalococcoidia bacterium]
MKITLGMVTPSGGSRANKTGAWRTAVKPRFLQKNCIACDVCALSCPEGCIFGTGQKTYYANEDFCKGCGICASVCPVHDIEMIPEGGEDA